MKTLADSAGRAEIAGRIAKLSPESPRGWGTMTSGGMICHLTDSYMVALGLRYASPNSRWINRTLIKWAALKLPARWPPGVPTRPEMDQEIGGTRPDDFEWDRRRLLEILERFCQSEDLSHEDHPVFGPMSQRDWLRWGYLHADHHLRQFGC